MTRSPSVTGEAEHSGLASCVSSFSLYVRPVCQSSLPLARSKLMTVRRCSASMAWVMKTRSPQTIGVEFPRSGSGVFQWIFFESLHSPGRFCSDVTPFACGPRQAGQLPPSAVAEVQTDNSRSRGRIIDFMAVGVARMKQNRSNLFSRDIIRQHQDRGR